MRAVLFGEKFATFPPEDYPIHNFYHELTEILLGSNCTPSNPNQPSMSVYSRAYDFISNHFFYIYPTSSPSPEYTRERFLELVIKEGIDGCDIDPWNQMSHSYNQHGGMRDKYLEQELGHFLRFAQQNNVYLWIVAHPVKMMKDETQNYPCPDVFDVEGGAMWNNKANNILVFHRPFKQIDPMNPACEFHSKKIKDQKSVGLPGWTSFEYMRTTRRYMFGVYDPLAEAIRKAGLTF
jgi:twinkle protein